MALHCPYCGNKADEVQPGEKLPFKQKVINLEAGRPFVDIALERMVEVVRDSTHLRVTVLTLIHGYGSSGKGGAIREECRKMLEFMKSKKQIRDYILGEDFQQRAGKTRSLLQRYPQLKNDHNLNKANKGITLVILF